MAGGGELFCGSVVERRRGAESGEPRQRNSLTQVKAGTSHRTTGPFRAPRSRVCNDPGQVVSHSGDVSLSLFLRFLPKRDEVDHACRLAIITSGNASVWISRKSRARFRFPT